ncbi:ATP-dependent RNA helicase DDX51 isoform X1 [Embiotoca jacksoni]|uniref:ATP-dependent RNA helicase DDX51 isoform X1 n=1 Tax=Embiotoca jacksoni TaxID=100190 RepID=UPI0037043B76
MSLFLMNRYLGEEEEDGSVSKESRSQALLAKLQQKAKEKQKKSEDLPGDHLEQKRREERRRKRTSPPAADDINETKRTKKSVKERPQKKSPSGDPVETVSEPPGGGGAEDTGGHKEEEDSLKQSSETSHSAPAGFTVLGGFESRPVQKVNRVLPQWLAEPDVIHRDIRRHLVPIADVSPLSPHILKTLHTQGIMELFPVQAEVIPAILESATQGLLIGRGGYKPRDICVSAPTGSGKTLSFVIPVVQVLMERVVCEVRALAVLPTKELAQQVYKVFSCYTEGTGLKVVMLAGQKSFAAEQASLSELRGGVARSLADIIVATPGRLVDHINKNSGFCLEHLRFLVSPLTCLSSHPSAVLSPVCCSLTCLLRQIIDEADRMIDSMHQSWLSQAVKAVYRPGSGPEPGSMFRRTVPAHITAASLSPPQVPLQKLLFSATLTQNPEKLQQLGLHQPRLFSSAHSSTTPEAATQKPDRFDFPEGLTEYYVPCTLSKKPLLLLHFILRMKLRPVLCFTNSRETAHRLHLLLQLFGGVQAAEFSSRLSPAERKRTLRDFEQGKLQLLISTDAAARGIDISGVKYVVNYDAPQYVRTYVHRVGRTARAGKAGLAFTFLLSVQEKNFLQMVVDAGSPGIQKQMVKPQNLKSLEVQYERTLQELADVIKGEKTKQ